MCQIIHLPPSAHRLRLLILLTCILCLCGCAVMKKVEVKPSPLPSYPEEKIERNEFSVEKGADVIGRLAVIRLERGIHCRILQDTSAWELMQSVQQIQG